MTKDWTHLFEQYRDKRVALADDETTVLASATTAKESPDLPYNGHGLLGRQGFFDRFSFLNPKTSKAPSRLARCAG